MESLIPSRGWSRNSRGYLMWTSRRKDSGIRRGKYQHRVVVERLGAKLGEGMTVHHIDFDKTHNCPQNLLICPAAFNPARQFRCPYTGRFMRADEWVKMWGNGGRGKIGEDQMPDWVKEEW